MVYQLFQTKPYYFLMRVRARARNDRPSLGKEHDYKLLFFKFTTAPHFILYSGLVENDITDFSNLLKFLSIAVTYWPMTADLVITPLLSSKK